MRKLLLLLLTGTVSGVFADQILDQTGVNNMINSLVLDGYQAALFKDYTIFKNNSGGTNVLSGSTSDYYDIYSFSISDYTLQNTIYEVVSGSVTPSEPVLVWSGQDDLWNNMDIYQDITSQQYNETVKQISSTKTTNGWVNAQQGSISLKSSKKLATYGSTTETSIEEIDQSYTVGNHIVHVPPGCIAHVTDALFNLSESGVYTISGNLSSNAYTNLEISSDGQWGPHYSGYINIYDIANNESLTTVSPNYSLSPDSNSKSAKFTGFGVYSGVTSSQHSTEVTATYADANGNDTGVVCEGAVVYDNLSSGKPLTLVNSRKAKDGVGYVSYTEIIKPIHSSKPAYKTATRK